MFGRSQPPPPAAANDVFSAAIAYLENDCPYISDWLKEINKDLDPRVGSWFLMSSIFYPFYIAATYLFIIEMGRWYFSSRQVSLIQQWTILTVLLEYYNMALVILNGALGTMFAYWIYRADYSLSCQPVDRNPTGPEMRIAELVYCFFISKIIELMDTVFHVLRMKFGMLTFLHLYHHSSMIVATWIGVRYVPGGSVAIIAMINSWVHVLMYMYYELSLRLKERIVNRFLSYKKFVTVMQITQFVFTLFVCCTVLVKDCSFPTWVAYMLGVYMMGFIALFINFVCHMYL